MITHWDNILSEVVGLVKADDWDEYGTQEVRLADDSIARVAIEHDGDIVDGEHIDLTNVVIMVGDEAEAWFIGLPTDTLDIYESYAKNRPPWDR